MEEACHDFLSLPLSQLTSQPNREDEYARIEASGGKVIQWNGHRVFGVLAMSRSIGKRFGAIAGFHVHFIFPLHQ